LQKVFIEEVEQYEFELATSLEKGDKLLASQFKNFKWQYAFKLLSLYLLRCV
jgi:hypothetical protein